MLVITIAQYLQVDLQLIFQFNNDIKQQILIEILKFLTNLFSYNNLYKSYYYNE
jgi:hypothetical protein